MENVEEFENMAPLVPGNGKLEEIGFRLMNGDEDSQIQAAKQIRLLTKTSARNRSRLAEQGVITPLVSMLHSCTFEAQEASLLALLNIAVKNESNKIEIVKAGAMESLVNLLSDNNDLKEYAAAFMLTLSASNANKAVIALSGATRMLVEILKSGSSQAKIDAVMALYNLSTLSDNLPIILAAEPVPPLISLLKESKKICKMTERICALLESLSVFEEARNAIADQQGGFFALVEVIEDGSPQGREYAVGVILTMCQSSRNKYRDAILKEGIIPGLLELTIDGTPNAREKARVLLPILRESNSLKNNSPSSLLLEDIVHDIAAHVDGAEKASETAKILLSEMVQLSMKQLRHQTTFVCVPSDFSRSSALSRVSSI